ncbi:MAG: ABC transporter substrate-binding protein [Gaiellaceae bacterium]
MRRLLPLIGLLLLTACGGSTGHGSAGQPPDYATVAKAVSGLHGPARERRLLSLARAEGGQLDLYSSVGSDTLDPLVKAFGDAYGIDVGVYRADSTVILPRLADEAKAGYHGADVVGLNGLAMVELAKQGLLVPYASPSRANLVASALHRTWTASSFQAIVLSWNTKLVSERQSPRSWTDLADPRWHGRVALEASDFDWYAALWQYWVNQQGMAPARADRLFEQIARGALVIHGHSTLGQLMAAGEFALAPNYASRVDTLRSQGAALAWRPLVTPAFVEPQGVGLVRDARHPAAALLFDDWVLNAGQRIYAQLQNDAVRRDLLPEPLAKIIFIDPEKLAGEQGRWSKRYDELLTLGRAGSSG